MHTLIIALTFFISIVLESSFFPYVAIAGIVPNISLILLICYALRNNVEKIVIIGLLAGLVKDVAVGRIIGVSGITFVLMGFFISKYTNKIFPDHLTTPIILTIVGTLFHESVYLLFVFFLGFQVNLMQAFSEVWVIQLIYNFFFVIPVYISVRQIYSWHVMKKQY